MLFEHLVKNYRSRNKNNPFTYGQSFSLDKWVDTLVLSAKNQDESHYFDDPITYFGDIEFKFSIDWSNRHRHHGYEAIASMNIDDFVDVKAMLKDSLNYTYRRIQAESVITVKSHRINITMKGCNSEIEHEIYFLGSNEVTRDLIYSIIIKLLKHDFKL